MTPCDVGCHVLCTASGCDCPCSAHGADQPVRVLAPPAGKNDHEPDGLYPGGLSTPRVAAGDRMAAVALAGPWLVAATGWAFTVAVLGGLVVVRRWLR